jgi:hypothetical protein
VKFWQYNKFWVALAGAAVTVVTVIWGDAIGAKAQMVVTAVVPVITAMLVAAVPNAEA